MAEELEDQINDEEIQDDVEWVTDNTTSTEYINTFCYALTTMESYNVMTKEDREVIDNIKAKSLRIVEKFVNETYNELFDD
jgi:urocanate hydratase